MGSTAANRSDSTVSGKETIYNSYVQLLDLQNDGELEMCVKFKKALVQTIWRHFGTPKEGFFFVVVHCNCYKTSTYNASVRPDILGNIGKSVVSLMLAIGGANIHCDLCIQRVLVSS